jgi:hypothetical protein
LFDDLPLSEESESNWDAMLEELKAKVIAKQNGKSGDTSHAA